MRWKKLPILLISLSFLISPALAQEPEGFAPLNLQLYDPTLLLLSPDDPQNQRSKNDYIEIYAQNCLNANEEPEFDEYMQLQCGCTAAEMFGFMDEKQLQTMFDDTESGNFEYARMMTLGYIPCMADTIQKFSYDTCLFDGREQYKTKSDIKLCQCFSDAMNEFTLENAHHLIPGFSLDGFDKKKAVANSLGYFMATRAFERKSQHETHVCGFRSTLRR